MTEKRHARKNDPRESHEAAAQMSTAELSQSKRDILRIMRRYGPMTNDRLVALYGQAMQRGEAVFMTPQSVRSRKADLAKDGFVERVAQGESKLGNKAGIWRAV